MDKAQERKVIAERAKQLAQDERDGLAAERAHVTWSDNPIRRYSESHPENVAWTPEHGWK